MQLPLSAMLLPLTLLTCQQLESEVIVAVSRRLFISNSCVGLLTQPGLSGSAWGVTAQSQLALRGVWSATVELAALRMRINSLSKMWGKPLLVLPPGPVKIHTLASELQVVGPTWLLFLDNSTKLDAIFHDVNIRYDAMVLVARSVDGGVELTEVHRVAADQPLQQHWFASWSQRGGLKATPITSLYMRRSDLGGITLITGALHEPPIINLKKNGSEYHIDSGLSALRWSLLQQGLNFTYSLRTPAVGFYGDKAANGSWGGILGMAQRREVDLIFAAMANAPDRHVDFDYALPYYIVKFYVYISELDGRDVTWSNFLSPFTAPLWLATVFTALSVVLTLRYVFRRRDAAFHVFAAVFCQQSHEQSPRAGAARLVYLISYMLGVVVLGSYSAYLTSSFTVIRPRTPFTTLQGLLEDGTYEIQAQKNAVAGKYFKNAEGGLLKQIYDTHMAAKIATAPASSLEAMQRVCAGRFAFICASTIADILQPRIPCKLFPLPEVFVRISTTMAVLPKNSPYTGVINKFIMRQYPLGVLRLADVRATRKMDSVSAPFTGIDLEQVTPILAFFALGALLAVIIALIETLHMHSRRKYLLQRPKRRIKLRLKQIHRPRV